MEKRGNHIYFIYAFVVAVFVTMVARLFYLQVVVTNQFGEVSAKNSIRRIPIEPARGTLFDRDTIPIVSNKPYYTVQVVPSEFDRTKAWLLAGILDMTEQTLLDRLDEAADENPFLPVRLKRDVDFKTLSQVEENKWQLPGTDCVMDAKRKYPDAFRASHLFGYTKEISRGQLQKIANQTYTSGDLIGASGLEKTYEEILRGRKGFRTVTVNSVGKVVGDFANGQQNIEAENGNDLILTLDTKLQVQAESLLVATGKSGAVVALDPNTGEILAMTSKPDYDPNLLGGFIPVETWKALSTDEGKPLFNRTIQTAYPPGSTYKMVLAMAALQEKVVTKDFKVTCTGYFTYGNKVFTCHEGHGHGTVDMQRAIQVSCNTYFYTLMLKLGFDKWTQYGRELGFGKVTGIDMPDEKSAVLPSTEYFDRIYGEKRWTKGYLVSLGIGQGEMGASPIQMACYAAALATKGIYTEPHLVKAYRDRASQKIIPFNVKHRRVNVSEENFDIVREGMRLCVESGTGVAAKLPDVVVAGKTGTAQNPHGENHAWFICFAPYDKPKIAICVLVENAGQGGRISAPIAGRLIDFYLHRQYTTNIFRANTKSEVLPDSTTSDL